MNSYVCGTSAEPLVYTTISGAFAASVARWPNKEFLVSRHQDRRFSYAQMQREVERTAAALHVLGLRPGDRVGIWSPNNAEWVITQLATARAGLILVNINPAYRVAELEYALNKAGCRALILADTFKTSDYLGMLRQLAPEVAECSPGQLRSANLPDLELLIHLGEQEHAGLLRFADLGALANANAFRAVEELQASLDPDDAINIQFTSGTTGFPKGATLSHFNILNNANFCAQTMHYSAADRLCLPVPLYHCFGMVIGILACMSHGAAVVLPDEGFEPGSVLGAVEEEHCTSLYGVPTMFIALLDHPGFADFDLSSLRTGVMAGAPCPVEVMKRVVNEMHMKEVTIAYGMTETSPVSFQSATDDPIEKRVTTVGRVHPHVQVKIVDADGRVVQRGARGELCTRGYSVMRGYWGDNERTAEAIDAAGWIHTGDLAVLDDAGYCEIVGRLKDMIIRGGENIYPREIEEYLFRHPKVRDAAVFGIPDKRYGEQVAAWICLKNGVSADAEEIRSFCKDKIAHFKIPAHVRFVDAFPMTVTGKIQKFVMREAMQKELRD